MKQIIKFAKRDIDNRGRIIVYYSFGKIIAKAINSADGNINNYEFEHIEGWDYKLNIEYLSNFDQLSLLSGIEEEAEFTLRSYINKLKAVNEDMLSKLNNR